MAFTLLLLISCLPAAQNDAPDALQSEVRRLVGQLDTARLSTRDSAEADLIKLGPKALEFLPATTDRTSAEAAQRLARIVQKLQQAAAETTVKPSLITLHGRSMPLKEALMALERQSDNKIEIESLSPAKGNLAVKTDFDDAPFWRALDQVLDQAALTVDPYSRQSELALVDRGANQSPRAGSAFYNGPFRFEAVGVATQRDLRDPSGDWLRVKLEVAWEPRLRPIALKLPMRDVRAFDDNAAAIAVENERAVLEMPAAGQNKAVEFLLPFQLPPRTAKQIARLKGTLQAIIPGRVETFRFENFAEAKNVEKRIAEATVSLIRAEKTGRQWQVRMRVRFDRPGEALQSHRLWINQNEAYLENPEGKRIAFTAVEPVEQAADAVAMLYTFPLDGPAASYSFVYKTPASIITTGFDYELKGLKLP
jgi:hypothetical protein